MPAVQSPAVANRYDFCLLYDVTNGNPNGDPDAGNSPRMDPESGHGLVSDVCLKRKIRNFISLVKTEPGSQSPAPSYDIYVKERAILNHQHDLAYAALKLKPDEKDSKKKTSNQDAARKWMCQNFFDIRMFGAVMTTGTNCGQVRGPVQIAFSQSVSPIVSLEQSITRMAVTTRGESDKQEGGNRTMGRKEIVPYALYRVHGFINPYLAAQTGFSDDDLELFWTALGQMFETDRSASRGEMSARRLVIFKHESPLGNAQAHQLFERVTVKLVDESRPPRKYSDYEVTVQENNLPSGISLLLPF